MRRRCWGLSEQPSCSLCGNRLLVPCPVPVLFFCFKSKSCVLCCVQHCNANHETRFPRLPSMSMNELFTERLSQLTSEQHGHKACQPCTVRNPHRTFDSMVSPWHPWIQSTTNQKQYFRSMVGNVNILFSILHIENSIVC